MLLSCRPSHCLPDIRYKGCQKAMRSARFDFKLFSDFMVEKYCAAPTVSQYQTQKMGDAAKARQEILGDDGCKARSKIGPVAAGKRGNCL
jgi:hypothetical protein